MVRTLKSTGILLMLSLAFLFCTCRNDGSRERNIDPAGLKDPLIEANKEAARLENEQIDDFVRRRGWKMDATGTGIRYMVIQQGQGSGAETGRTVELEYTLSLLTGDTVYTSAADGPLMFVVGNGQVITGLEEAILLLKVGDRAKIIIPSHLAFGLIGDQNKINHKASLVYDLEFTRMY